MVTCFDVYIWFMPVWWPWLKTKVTVFAGKKWNLKFWFLDTFSWWTSYKCSMCIHEHAHAPNAWRIFCEYLQLKNTVDAPCFGINLKCYNFWWCARETLETLHGNTLYQAFTYLYMPVSLKHCMATPCVKLLRIYMPVSLKHCMATPCIKLLHIYAGFNVPGIVCIVKVRRE